MAIELMDEHEQGERVRSWLRENGSAIIGGIALGVAAVAGYQWWGQSQSGHRADASVQFMALQEAAEAGKRDAVESITASLIKDYADTPYAILADLALADVQLQAGEQEAALTSLRRAAAASAEEGMKQLVTTRIARVEIAAGKFEQALKTLEAVKAESMTGIRDDLKGDALRGLGRQAEAVAAYQTAYAAYVEGLPSKRLVELKLSDLGVKVKSDEA